MLSRNRDIFAQEQGRIGIRNRTYLIVNDPAPSLTNLLIKRLFPV